MAQLLCLQKELWQDDLPAELFCHEIILPNKFSEFYSEFKRVNNL